MSEQVAIPGFIVNLIGRLVAENEALRMGLVPIGESAAEGIEVVEQEE